MKTNTVNISFQKDLLGKIDRVARDEFRTRSELIREAARKYIESRMAWKEIFAFGKKQVKQLRLKEADVPKAIALYRRHRNVSSEK